MKPLLLTAALIGATLGCATPQRVNLAPVGPEHGTRTPSPSNAGTLIVHSAWRRTGTDDADHRIHSNYEILKENGTTFLNVRNYVTPMLEDPATVPLAPGKYIVKARVQRYGIVEIPVVIETRKVTALYLDDSTRPSSALKQTERVELPDGRVIGWASAPK